MVFLRTLAACGGAAVVPSDAAARDAVPPSAEVDATTADVNDAAPVDGPSEGPADAGPADVLSEEVGSDAGADAPSPEAATVTLSPPGRLLCESVWPQPDNFFLDLSTPYGVQMAVDPTGDVYLAMSYGTISNSGTPQASAPPPDLGTDAGTLPGYPMGLAVVKLDPSCNVLWAKEYGSFDVNQNGVQSVALGVDDASNVTVLGAGAGRIDLEGPVSFDPPDAQTMGAGFLLRLDSNGSLVFRDVFTSDQNFFAPLYLAVSPSGVSTVIAGALGNVSLGAPASGSGAEAGPASPYDAGWSIPTYRFLFQLDTLGRVLQVTPAPYYPSGIQAGPDGTLWMLDANSGDGGPGGLAHFSSSASPLWTLPASGYLFAAGGPGAVVFDGSHNATAQLQAFASDGTLLWTQPPSAYDLQGANNGLAIDPAGNIILGGNFGGTSAWPAPAGNPVGVGYETFDPGGVLRSVNVFSGVPDAASGQDCLGIAVDPSGAVLVAGTQQNSWATTSVFVAKYAPSAFDGAADGGEGE